MAAAPTILVFDSGVGGLTVYREVAAMRPDARYVYIADDAGFPYGEMPEEALIERVVHIIGKAIADHAPELVVVACNTASTLALAELRERFSVPFVGTVPAIKPACAQSVSKLVSVLGTQATVGREYTRALIREFASGCDVHLVGSPRLAAYAEAELAGAPWPTPQSQPKSPAVSSKRMDGEPTRSCLPARIIPCCSTAFAPMRPGPSPGSIRRRRLRAASRI